MILFLTYNPFTTIKGCKAIYKCLQILSTSVKKGSKLTQPFKWQHHSDDILSAFRKLSSTEEDFSMAEVFLPYLWCEYCQKRLYAVQLQDWICILSYNISCCWVKVYLTTLLTTDNVSSNHSPIQKGFQTALLY